MQTKAKTSFDERTFRTFIAIKIKPEIELLVNWQKIKKLLSGEKIKWVDQRNVHITLQFLGDTTLNQIEKLNILLQEVVEDFAPFYFYLDGIDYFQNNKHPKVIFVNTTKTYSLEKLALAIHNQTEKIGFAKEKRSFKPHLTIGRIKYINDKKRFYQVIENYQKLVYQKIMVSEIILYQSILQPAGPVYKPLEIFKLQKR